MPPTPGKRRAPPTLTTMQSSARGVSTRASGEWVRGGDLNAASTGMVCNVWRCACPWAWAPKSTGSEVWMRAVDEARAEPGPELPVYQATVFDAPLTSDVADPGGVPPTCSGG